MAGEHSELLRVLKRDCDAENAEAERHRAIARHMEQLIKLLESGATPTAEQLSHLHNGNGAGHTADRSLSDPRQRKGAFGRKYARQSEFESLSTIAAIRKILAEHGPTHADVLAKRIYKFDPADFQKVKSAIVSEAVKQVKDKKMRRTGENVFALMEKV